MLTGEYRVAAIIVVHLFGIALTVLLWLIAVRLMDSQSADRSVALFWFFPGAAVLSMVYAESVMITFAAASLLSLLHGRWVLAGISAALATATRPNAMVLVACCLWQAMRAIRFNRDWRALIAPVLAPCGLLAYFGFLWMRFDNFGLWLQVQQQGWGARIDFGSRTLREIVSIAGSPLDVNTTSLLQLFGLLFAIVSGVLLWRWRPKPIVIIYSLGILAVALLSQTDSAAGARPRFVLAAFPLIFALARYVKGAPFLVLLGVSALGMIATAVVYTTPLWVIP
jgi:hypothetical protein